MPLIDAKVDFYALTRHLHKNIIFENDTSSVILAEGYMYMMQWYREQVQNSFTELDYLVDCYLLKYEPALEEQVIRQKKKFKEIGLGWEETDDEHQRQLAVKWRKFEAPQDKELSFEIVDDTSIPILMSEIMEASFKMEDETLVKLVRDRVRLIPAGFVMSYGQVGDEVGCSAREAGWAMNQIADEDEAPWQRVVGSDGYLRIAKRSAAWAQRQRTLLEAEGVAFKANDCVDMAKHRSGTSAGTLEAEKTAAAGTLELGFE